MPILSHMGRYLNMIIIMDYIMTIYYNGVRYGSIPIGIKLTCLVKENEKARKN